MGSSQVACTSGEKKEYITGNHPSISANEAGDVVCVCNNIMTIFGYHIYDAVGRIDGGTVQWDCQNYVCQGENPKIAINGVDQVVMVYTQSSLQSSLVRYRMGQKDSDKINWNKNDHDICQGKYPSVAMSGDKIVVIFQNGANIDYCFGTVESDSIEWKRKNVALQANGSYPSVSIEDKFAVVLFEHSSRLMTKVGDVGDNDITWGEKQDDTSDTKNTPSPSEFDGSYPSIAILRDGLGTVVATFQRGIVAGRTLAVRCGELQLPGPKSIKWHEPKAGNFVHGAYSSVTAVDKDVFIEMHATNAVEKNGIWFHVCKVS